MESLLQYVEREKNRYLEELFEYLRIPSISALSQYRENVVQCAKWLSDHLKTIGLDRVEVFVDKGNPIVYGEWLRVPDKPTVLIYGHYDVQPPEPLEEWITPPFEPAIREGRIYARGAADNKGNLFSHLKAVEAYLRVKESLPVNVKFILEGEEETGSENTVEFIKTNRKLLEADLILNPDMGRIRPDGTPEMDIGVRGICMFQIDLIGANRDLHSGLYGGTVVNPNFVLCHLLSKLKDARTGKVLIPGFYQDVEPITEKERKYLAQLPFDEEDFKNRIGVPQLFGERGYTVLERIGYRPTLEINGMWGGYTGEGIKNIVPARASAKISMRLVPDQDPEKVSELFENYVKEICPNTVKLEIKRIGGLCHPWAISPDLPQLKLASESLKKSFGREPIFVRSGGTIGVVPEFDKILKIPIVSMGFGSESNVHAPNENLRLDYFYKGIETVIYFLQAIAKT